MMAKLFSFYPKTWVVLFCLIVLTQGTGQTPPNTLSQDWIEEHLASDKPRIIFTPEAERQLRSKLETDQNVQVFYQRLKEYADRTLKEAPLKRELRGRRLLSVSREAITRTLSLAMVYRIEKEAQYLIRLEEELNHICRFPDWNPDHFLDVAEMAVAVSLPLDWLDHFLSPETKAVIQAALIEKAIKPSIGVNNGRNWWWTSVHNWNLVCHGGLAVAALAIYEEEPDLASHILNRSYQQFPLGLEPYIPDGAYNEGPSYWFYATNYLVLTLSALESSLGTDLNFIHAPGVKKSVLFSEISAGPSGDYFNYFDANLNGYRNITHAGLLAWFSPRLGFDMLGESFDAKTTEAWKAKQNLDRFTALYVLFLSQIPDDLAPISLPEAWLAKGDSPVGIFRSKEENDMYLAAKGGSAYDNHGNMDAGSFILEWKKIRWSIDPGNQDYKKLEEIIGVGPLWDRSQDSERWKLLTKNNFGHSTLTINAEQHAVKARALVSSAKMEGKSPSFSLNLSPLFGENVDQAIRSFHKRDDRSMRILDEIDLNENTHEVQWSLMTTAEVSIEQAGVRLSQSGASVLLHIESNLDYQVKVVPLDPPPLVYDKKIEGLKRLDLIIKPNSVEEKRANIQVDIIGE